MSSVSSTYYLTRVYPLEEVHRFIRECMIALGTSEVIAEDFASCLVEADYRGHSSEGLNRLGTYIREICEGGCNKNGVPQILKESPSTALVDGHNGLGVVVGNFCMNLAIKKARSNGIGLVVARGSNRYGCASHYTLQALRKEMIGMSFTNTSPMVAHPNSNTRVIGTNPLSLAAPGFREDSFVLDMATSVVSAGKVLNLIETYTRMNLGITRRKYMTVPPNWANTSSGTIYPIGGVDSGMNYKGFGLGMMVEVLCGILSGSAYGPYIRKYGDVNQVSNFGQCFIAINPSFFELGFEQRLSEFMNIIRNLETSDPENPVMVPGDPSRAHMSKVDAEGGIHYLKELIDECDQLARKFNITPLRHRHLD